jgi:hypothetical protein
MQFASALQGALLPGGASKRAAGAAVPDHVGRLAFEPHGVSNNVSDRVSHAAPGDDAHDASDAPVPGTAPRTPVERTRATVSARPVAFPDDVERPELPLFDLSLHDAPELADIPGADAIHHTLPPPSFGAMRTESRPQRSRGLLIVAALALLAVVGTVAFYVSGGWPGGGTAIEDSGRVASAGGDSPEIPGADGRLGAGGGDSGVTRLDDVPGALPEPLPEPRPEPRREPRREPLPAPLPVDPKEASPRAPDSPAPGPGAPPGRQTPPVVPEVTTEPLPRASRPAPPAGARVPGTSSAPAAASTPVPAADDSGAEGRVLVRSTPAGARVVIDGEPRGETPVAVRGLEFGGHTISVAAPGFPVWEQRVVLTPERPSFSVEVALDTGATASGASGAAGAPPATAPGSDARPPAAAAEASLRIESRPAGAQVWMNGSYVGTTPFALPRVVAGLHLVRIEMDGFRPWTTSVTIGQGERVRVAASLER